MPRLAVSVSLLLSLATVALLVYFLHHVTRMLRVDAIMDEIAAETLAQIQDLPPRREVSPDQAGVDPPAGSRVVTARSEGYLQRVDVDALARGARPQAVVVRLRPVIGEWVARGTTLAWAWGEDDPAAVDLQAVGDVVHASLHLGPDRTESADLAFGLRQLQDIAARALSPGINDPTTAVQAIGQMSSVVASLSRHPLGADIGVDDQDTVRTVAPRPTFAAHLELAVGQSRRYGRREPDVLIALLSLLTDAGELVADAADRAEAVRGQIARVEAAADLDDPGDLERVGAAAEVARRTLEAGVRPASTSDAG